ncbi:patatin-like phospholipase family protein [Actinomadura scrupuli]|uniref:patatin-like phospholipase family protein n=1 Tax=Actinomadura scrupuli TaxID=559629 RepID=UPI003D982D7D
MTTDTRQTGRALVLGGGGIAGIAWEAGLVVGLQGAGVDLTDADLIVGTSAGSVVGSMIAMGVDLPLAIDDLAGRAETAAAPPPPVDFSTVLSAFGVLFDTSLDPQEARARVGAMALEAPVADAAGRLREIGDRLPGHEWPERPLLITAVDTADGDFRVWDRDSGTPLPLAVMSSCAVPCVFPPVEIDGRFYMDGGVRSATNADLAAGFSAVVIIEPMAHLSPRALLERELAALDTANVVAIGPDQHAVEAFGHDVLDPALWRPAYHAGIIQAGGVVDRVQEVWKA